MSGCIPYRRRPSPVRNMRAVLKKASYGTRRVFRSPPCSKQASGVQKGYSVPETPFYGTEQAMCTGKGLLMHRMKRRKAASALRSVILRKTAICMLLLLPLNSCIQLWAATKPLQTATKSPPSRCKPLQIATDCHGQPQTAAKQPQSAMDYLKRPQTTANSAKLSQAAASYSQTTAEPTEPLPGSRKLRRSVSVNRRSNSMIIFARTKL